MSVPFSNTRLRVPQGFHTLLETLTREILRRKPANIYEYAAAYLENLAKDKQEGKLDNLLQQSLLDDRFYNNNSFKESYPLNNERIDDAAVKIQSSYRGHQTRSELANEKAEIKEEIKVEKKHEQIAEHKPSKDEVHHETRTESKSASVIVRSLIEPKNEENVQDNKKNVVDEPKSHLNDEKKDLNEAVTKIQSTFRGYKTRKDLEEKADETYTEERENVPIDSNKAENPDESKAAAATKIQATFRGYQTRKEMSGKLHDSK